MKAFSRKTYIKHIFILLFTSFIIHKSYALQDYNKSYKEIIEPLSSDSLFGRSIFNNGKNKALDFLKVYLRDNSPKEIKFKEFSFDTTFNQIGNVSLSINNVLIRLENNYLPSGNTPSINKNTIVHAFLDEFFIRENHPKLKQQELNGDFAIIKKTSKPKDDHSISLSEKISLLSYLGAKAIFIETDVLMFSPSVSQEILPLIWILPNLISDKDSISLKITSSIEKYTVTNLLATPSQITTKPALTLMAHYDHLGTINNSLIYNGANDNASGVALAINLFLLSMSRTNQTQLILTDAEELGLLGSKALQHSGKFHPISYLINLDMMGSQTKGLATVGFNDHDSAKERLISIADSLSINLKFRTNSPNSDHYFFLENGVKGFYIYSNEGKQPYHKSTDDYLSLDYDFLIKSEQVLNQYFVYLGF
jgi:hypothetical protein